MVDDTISRQAAIEKIEKYFGDLAIQGRFDILSIINNLPSAQRTGRWILVTGRAICTVCGKSPSWCYIEGSMEWPYCPNCGCAMKGEQDG